MDKKPLIGISFLAVVLLVMGSLSNVVGHQSVKSNAVNHSPLFTVRAQRATDQQQNSIVSQYLGMGKGKLLPFPMRDNNVVLLKKVIEIINHMSKKTFAQFTELCIRKVNQDTAMEKTDAERFFQTLYLLKTKPTIMISTLLDVHNQSISSNYPNICYLLDWIIFIPILFYGIIMWFLLGCPDTIMPTCNDPSCPG